MIRSCCFDIETSSLNADFGIILCAVIKEPNSKPLVLRTDKLNKNWKTRRSDDRAICQKLHELLPQYDIIIAHNGLYFDIPFLRTRCSKWGMPPLQVKTIIDPYRVVKYKMKLSSCSLETISQFFPIRNGKTPVSGDVWVAAALDGDIKAMDYIVEHCKQDVLILEELLDIIKDFSPLGKRW